MKIADIRTLLPHIEAEMPDINYQQLVVDQSQLTEFLQKRNKDDNNMLFFIIPEHTHRGTDDSILTITNAQILIMARYAEKDSHEDFLNIMQATEETAFKVRDWMLQHKEDNPCGVLRRLVDSSFQILPVWEFVSCHGWSINFNVEYDH